ncbi:MAG: T9SS type A sorting domain-containing protein, partial [Clostridia bacterium]|nr:T9SS type A sorting domain-containing protein [Clostridia bacterium]
FDMQRILVEWDGYIQYLLETEVITAITIDAANRKWVGTKSSGVYLLSEDGEKQIHHFTADNSPLLSNEITSIKINADGEVFIGTAAGLISFRGEASVPRVEGSKVYAFPNPVREGYSGSIAIKNLSQNSNVKITDISGNVVFETHSLGGQAIWNGYNFEGKKAGTGVYLVFASNEKGTVNLVTKILFIN